MYCTVKFIPRGRGAGIQVTPQRPLLPAGLHIAGWAHFLAIASYVPAPTPRVGHVARRVDPAAVMHVCRCMYRSSCNIIVMEVHN